MWLTETTRGKWMFKSIQGAFQIDPNSRMINADEFFNQNLQNRKALEDFLNGEGAPRLLIYYQPEPNEDGDMGGITENKLLLVTGDVNVKLENKAVYFLRTTPPGKPVNTEKIDNEVLFGEVTAKLLDQLKSSTYLILNYLVLQKKDEFDKADPELYDEFKKAVEKFDDDLSTNINSLHDSMTKCVIDASEEAKARKDDEGNQGNKGQTSNFRNLCMRYLQQWVPDLEKKIEGGQDDIMRQDETDGPDVEIRYWRERLQSLTMYSELMKPKGGSDYCRAKEEVSKTGSDGSAIANSLLQRCQELENNLTEKLNEAKDNVKYLATLEKFTTPLKEGTPEEIMETLPALMNAIKMIHTIARYFKTSQKLTSLFQRITNAMIANCKRKILDCEPKDKPLWEKNPGKLIEVFESCIKLSHKYKDDFNTTKMKNSDLPKARQWDFDNNMIFSKFDKFIKRVRKLIEIFSIIKQFDALNKHKNLEGIQELNKNFRAKIDAFKAKNNEDVTDVDTTEFDRNYVELMQSIQKLDDELQVFIERNFSKFKIISYSLKLLKKLKGILKSNNIKNRLESKYETILQNYGSEIEAIIKRFDDNRADPPILRNMPNEAGKIIWVRHLFERLNGPMQEFPENMISHKEMRRYIDKFNMLGKNLIVYEIYFTRAWCADIERAKSCLQTPLLAMKEENGQKKIKVNFEKDIQKLIREAKALDREGIEDIPESAKIILLQEEKFKNYYYELDFIKNEYERIIDMIKPVMRNILKPHIEDLDLKIRPGMVTLTWTSMNIDGYLQHVQMSLSKLEQLIININDIIDNRIENNLKTIGKVELVKLPQDGKPMSLDGFVDEQKTHIETQATYLISKNIEIERAVDDLLETVMKYPLETDDNEKVDQKALLKIKGYYFWYLYQALLNATQNSLISMKKRICGERSKSSNQVKLKPFFEVNIRLESKEITFSPTLEDLDKSISRAATEILSCSKKLMRWTPYSGSRPVGEEGESFYQIIAQDKEIVKVILLLTGSLKNTKDNVSTFKKSFESFKELYADEMQGVLDAFAAQKPTIQQYEGKLKHYAEIDRQIDRIASYEEIGAMSFKTESLITGLKDKCKEWRSAFSKDLHNKARAELTKTTEYMKTLNTKLTKDVTDINSLGSVMATLEEIRKKQATIEMEFGPILDMYALLDFYLPNQVTEKEEMDNKQQLREKWAELVKSAEEVQSRLQDQQSRHLKVLKQDQKKLWEDVKELRRNFEESGPKVPGINPKEASDRLANFEEVYKLRDALYVSNQKGENLFGLQNLVYPELSDTKKDIDYLKELYDLYNKVNEETGRWEESIWSEIESAHIKEWDDRVNSYFATECNKMNKGLRGYQAFADMKAKIENYRDILPLVYDMKDYTSFEDRHWEELCQVTGKNLNYKLPENFFFKDLILADLKGHMDEIEEIINSGKKQKSIKKNKQEIIDSWKSSQFEFKKWGKTGVSILKGDRVQAIQEQLENDISTLSGLSANKHIGPFKDEVINWQRILSDIEKTLSDWIKVQMLWTSLEAVFTGGDIAKHLKNEAKKFKNINKSWKMNVMNKAVEQINVLGCCQNDIIKGSLPNLYEELVSCQKELDKYLEQKRKSFPRFYFVSNQVLLKFLSQGSEPESVQDELDKLFDSISKANFIPAKGSKSGEKSIDQLKGARGDDLETIFLTADVPCIGNVEDWLKELERQMQLTIKQLIKTLNSRFIKKHEMLDMDAYLKFSAQITLIGLQMRWTKVLTEAMEDRAGKKDFSGPKAEVAEYLRFLTEKCKDPSVKSKLDRTKLETLVLISVYLDDAVRNKIKNSIKVTEHDWLKFTRVYWKDNMSSILEGDCVISITDWNAFYSYEYLGVKERLCITPLTDRCYITLAQAMSMNYGGSPVGPAGTGKTETVKDLGNTLGIWVVVTNCSGEHRSGDMAKIFKGLCQSGLWGCFDEFNRIMSEVLSVIAMQVESITNAKKADAKELNFPGEVEKIPLKKTCGYFITMNPPSYGGRQKLPENLKVLFRGISMMVPNREVIIQVKLASSGYKMYESLAKKFNVLYALCEEQLSKQRHYDFGLRNILSVLRTAGDSLREDDKRLKDEAALQGKPPVEPDEPFLMMRTLRDMNLSKLVAQDTPLFEALLQDIFVGSKTPTQKVYEGIEPEIRKKIAEYQLEEFPSWYRKIIQVYETNNVRHGFMVIGPVGSGKSTIINILAEAMSVKMNKTIVIKLNPKAFTSQEMYGCNDFSGDWTPGVFSEIWDKANKKDNKMNTWITCDGPVDAVWIESLNTVLDDNKVLTLANGGRIFMRESVKMVFEVENLNNASAATVSRCGQIYVSDIDLGFLPIMEGWINQRTDDKKANPAADEAKVRNPISKLFTVSDKTVFLGLMRYYFGDMTSKDKPSLNMIELSDRIGAKNPIMKMFPALKMSQVLNLLNGILPPMTSTKNAKRTFSKDDYNKIILYCIIWGCSGIYEPLERLQFQQALEEKKLDLPKVKDGETIFDYILDMSGDSVTWSKITVPKWEVPKKIEFSQILMPTADAARADKLIRYIAFQEYSTVSRRSSLVIGGPGTAKTSSVLMYTSKFDSDMVLHRINFSSATQPIHFQMSIESVCEMKIQRGFGPKDQKQMTVFVDDFSMPELNKYGDQITLEIIRQLIEDGFFYNLEKVERGNPKYIENLRYVAAMNHPGGGRNDIPNRIKRQFFIFNMTLPERIDVIFDPILQTVFRAKDMTEETTQVVNTLSNATISLWKNIKRDLLPTPTKFHYIFNLRDVSRIFKGMCTVLPESIKNTANLAKGELKPEIYMIALWKHECERVFIDKLVENKEKLDKIRKYITDSAHENFPQYSNEMTSKLETKNYYFLNWARQIELDDNEEIVERPPRNYESMGDIDKIRKQAELFLRAYNKKTPQKAMDLVLFDDALGHLLRVSRIIEQKRSSALLVGVGGSGKQSLTRLASFILDQKLNQIVLTKGFNESTLKEFLKGLFDLSGHKNLQVCFIMTDAEIKKEEFLEYINMVLSTGEVPGLIPKDEKEIWMADVKAQYTKIFKGKDPNPQQVYEYFVNRLRDNLHIVLCFSPVGTKFRDRARKFPALFNECTIDWFLPWPKEALFNVAKQQIDNFDDLKTRKEIKDKELPAWMAAAHMQVDEICEAYYQQMRKTVYVTPKSYLFFIKSYKNLYSKEMAKLLAAERNYAAGLQKIKEGKEQVEIQEKEIGKQSIELEKKREEVKIVVAEITRENTKALEREKVVLAEKAKIEAEAAKISIDKADCEQRLGLALPTLRKAEEAANKVDSAMIANWKALLKQQEPTPTAKFLIEAMCVLLYQKVRNDIEIKEVFASSKDTVGFMLMDSSWKICKNILLDGQGLKNQLLARANKANGGLINDEILELIEPYIAMLENFLSANNVGSAASFNLPLRDWVEQIVNFSQQTRVIKPMQAALELQESKLADAMDKLRVSVEALNEIKKKIEHLRENLRINQEEADKLDAVYKESMKKIKKANNLISSLSEERERWKEGAEDLTRLKTELVGSVGLATAFISYCGPFSSIFRDRIAKEKFIKLLTDQKIPFTPNIYETLTGFLVDEATVGQWNLDGLPKDSLSIQNGIMVEASERYPLLIDPQGQGAFWIKNKYKGPSKDASRNRVTIVSPNEEKKVKEALRYCIVEGEVLILEGIQGEIDPMFDPVLEKQYIKSGKILKINLGEDTEKIDLDFKLFITCKLANPKFTPELSAKTTIIDFTVTQIGLEQQLLSAVLSKEQSALEEMLTQLLKKVTQNKRSLQDLDQELLLKLNNSTGNLLDDEDLLDILKSAKTQSKEISAQLAEADIKSKEINQKREIYRPVAIRGSVMYFCMIEIANVNWMYNSSLNQFLGLYYSSIDNSKDLSAPLQGKARVQEIESYLTFEVFEYVNRSLFSSHKITFLLMVCFKIMITSGEMNENDVNIFLKVGSNADKNSKPKPNFKWLYENIWLNILDLSNHNFCGQSTPTFKQLPDEVSSTLPEKWEAWFGRNDPEIYEIPNYNDNFKGESKSAAFIKFCLIRALRPDRTIVAANDFIRKVLIDKRFVETPAEDISTLFNKSSNKEPILYLLSEGADPTNSITGYAQKIKKIVTSVSLGEGQGAKANAIIREYMPLGNWILLQNCHLGLDYMQELENNLADPEFCKEMHKEFRVWMSCEPSDQFPLGLLQRSLKVTNEPPKGIKAGMRKTFKTIVTPDFLEKIEHYAWRSLCYMMSFLHSLMQERRKFGPIGWCIAYEFNDSDLEASLAFVEKYLNQLMAASGSGLANITLHNSSIEVINTMVMEIQYGGKVSDNVDREILVAYGSKYFKPSLVNPQNTGGEYYLATYVNSGTNELKKIRLPVGQDYQNYTNEVETLDTVDSAEIFGLSAYADIACKLKETREVIETLTETRPKEGGLVAGGMSKDDIIQQNCKKRLNAITNSYPAHIIMEHVTKLKGPKGYPSDPSNGGGIGYNVPLNVFLSQELQRMDRIIIIIKKTFSDIIEAVDGQILMTPAIVDSIDSLYNNKVPLAWLYDPSGAQISWMKLKFSVWFDSFKTRNVTLEDWMKGTRPKSYNLDHFFNPQGLLTSMKQEVVRINKSKNSEPNRPGGKNKPGAFAGAEWSMDKVEYAAEAFTESKYKSFLEGKVEPSSEGGIFLTGLWIEGACYLKDGLAEAKDKQLTTSMPPIEMSARPTGDGTSKEGTNDMKNFYQCPLYKYPMRTDDYLITKIPLKSATQAKDGSQSATPATWQLKGVALLCYYEA